LVWFGLVGFSLRESKAPTKGPKVANILKANADLKAIMLEQQRNKQPDAW
jgi:hypothetical protein